MLHFCPFCGKATKLILLHLMNINQRFSISILEVIFYMSLMWDLLEFRLSGGTNPSVNSSIIWGFELNIGSVSGEFPLISLTNYYYG